MKCPKCGFNSFEFLDNSKKCGNNLMAFKRNFGISPIVFASNQSMKAALLEPAVETLHEEVPLEAVGIEPEGIEPEGIEPEEAFTWDIPTLSETGTESDSKFPGFDLDFINGDKKPAEQEAVFSFDDEPVMESSDVEEVEKAAPSEEFSFYEQTLELGEEAVTTGMEEEQQGESDPFGQTGIIGELMPEQLQEELEGVVEGVVFSSAQSGYTVLRLRVSGAAGPGAATGSPRSSWASTSSLRPK